MLHKKSFPEQESSGILVKFYIARLSFSVKKYYNTFVYDVNVRKDQKGVIPLSKFFKRALGLAAVGGAVAAGVAYYLKKEDNSDDFLDEFDDDFATEDSDSSEREYVPLNTAPKAEAEEDKTKEDKTEDTVTPSEEENAEDTEEAAEAEAAEEKAE